MAKFEPTKTSKTAAYTAPKLTRFGDVSKLTANGSKNGQENNGNLEGTMV